MILNENVSLKKFNTMGVDVKARYFAEMTSPDDISILQELSEKAGNKFLVLGEGSNILFTGDYDGLVIRNMIKGRSVISEDDESVTLRFGAGENWDQTVAYCVENNLWGIENLSLIPGTTGASPIQNIGAYGQELKDTFESARVFFLDDKKIKEIGYEDCRFGYRDSIFKNGLKGKALILGVRLKLKKHPKLNFNYKGVREIIFKDETAKPGVKEIRDAIIQLRTEKLPDPAVLGNAGSFFKNPEISEESFLILQRLSPEIDGFKTKDGKVKISAAKLIELSGWKGRRVGNCGVYEKHSLVLVNYGGAGGSDIVDLANKIIEDVYQKFGIKLTAEVNFI